MPSLARIFQIRITWLAILATPFDGVFAQTPAVAGVPGSAAGFEVTSVRAIGKDQRPPARLDCPSGRFGSTVALGLVVAWAYGRQPAEISGGQAWRDASETRYQIDATANRGVGPDECRSMVRQLLADRFKLATRRETREQGVYTLEVAKNGPKLRPVSGAPKDPEGAVLINGRPVYHGLDGGALKGLSIPSLCGLIQLELMRPSRGLGPEARRPVVDKTGLNGVYRVRLDFSTGGQDDRRPDIFTALQEQLGLKLELRKEPVDVLFVDHVEPPDEN
jgi:uncharacterized protein (TIGR03435 family)